LVVCCSPARSLTVSGMRDTYDKTIHPNNTKIAWIEWHYEHSMISCCYNMGYDIII
jgi:hypothetical protein